MSLFHSTTLFLSLIPPVRSNRCLLLILLCFHPRIRRVLRPLCAHGFARQRPLLRPARPELLPEFHSEPHYRPRQSFRPHRSAYLPRACPSLSPNFDSNPSQNLRNLSDDAGCYAVRYRIRRDLKIAWSPILTANRLCCPRKNPSRTCPSQRARHG